jgi:hypothetical protein
MYDVIIDKYENYVNDFSHKKNADFLLSAFSIYINGLLPFQDYRSYCELLTFLTIYYSLY